MKRKISVLILTMLLCTSVMVFINQNMNVKADAEEENEPEGIGLDFDFMWTIAKKLSNVVHDNDVYPDGTIPKGRCWGTPGDRWTADYLEKQMKNTTYLDYVHPEEIGYLSGDFSDRKYSNKIVVNDLSISISHTNPNIDYEWETPVSISEIYPYPAAWPHEYAGNEITNNYTFNGIKILRLTNKSEGRGENWPWGGSYNDYHLNVSSDELLNDFSLVVGNVTYVESVEDIPNFQEGNVFIMNESQECEDIIANITNASGCILLHNDSRNYAGYQNASQAYYPILSVDEDENSNLTNITNMLKEGEYMFVDNMLNTDILTFTYNLDDQDCLPLYDFMWLMKIRKPSSSKVGYYDDIGLAKILTEWNYHRNHLPLNFTKCHGIILYDPFDTHFMSFSMRDWHFHGLNPPYEKWFEEPLDKLFNSYKNSPALPIFTVNESVGIWMLDNMGLIKGRPVIDGYLDQEYKEQTETTPGVLSYNVVGYRNITNSPDDKIVVISNRYDGLWGETPGDCGLGAGVVLAVAKYFNDYNITPKFNLTFLMTTGEEYGMRGAHHYVDSHPNENFTIWIGADQLGFNQKNTNLTLLYHNKTYEKSLIYDIIKAIADQTNYPERVNETYGLDITSEGAGGTETKVWKERCDSICFAKDNTSDWDMYQRAGQKYTKGDVLSNINRSDANITLEIFWNLSKYFSVWPDCWIDSGSANTIDSNDSDDFVDTINVNIDVKSIMPHDLAMVNFTLCKTTTNKIVMSKYMNFSVNRSQTSKSINITLPENEQPGFYTYKLDLYNSTGRINNIVGIGDDNINITDYSGFFFLYPYDYGFKIIPEITNVTDFPDPVGFGFNVTINADVTSNVSDIDTVTVNISYPDDTLKSYNMNNTTGDTYEYVFNDTWQNGQYDYVIWARDVNGNESGSSQYSFDVSVDAIISVCTVKDSYNGNETINLTDPPGSSYLVGYEFLDGGDVLHIWNKFDSYYFNTSSGIQLTNHYNEYWSHNVLMLGYYNNGQWNLIYRSDNLSSFNQDIESDNETFVDATLWKDLSYGGYYFRLTIRYHLGVDDNELTIIPYIKNIGEDDIPYNLGFAWEIKDIQIDMTIRGDYIDIDGTTQYLNNSGLDETYTNMDNPCFYIREDTGDGSESLYLRWDEDLNYKVHVKSRDGQYNAPVTLGIKIGTLSVGQEKSTELFWHDASEVIYYFNNYNPMFAWAANPAYMVDGNTSTYASTMIDRDVEILNINLDSAADKGAISKVEIRAFGKYSGGGVPPIHDILLKVLGGMHIFSPTTNGSWSNWYDITGNPYAPDPWTWTDVDNLIVEVETSIMGLYTLYCSKVDIRVTYNPNPVISSPYPPSGSKGITITPVINITVSDPQGDTLNITWLSNSSGSWQIFGRNNSVGNGTYHQTFSNATVNGKWWYWKVNVSDGINTVTSNVFSFYTGYQSKIENTGSTNFTGYLLMQIEYYNTTNSTWILEQVVVNESTPRTINAGSALALDTIFNPYNVSTSSFSNGVGTYRVYVSFRDPDGDVLVCDDETEIEATYEFTISFE